MDSLSNTHKNMQIQAMRGICMICVCFIHVLGTAGNYTEELTVVLRTAVNFCTAVFFFISANLTNINKVKSNTKKYLIKRIANLYTPFIFYSLFYTLINKGYDFSNGVNAIKSVLKVLIGSNSAQLYFIIILIIYTLISPILIKIIESKNAILNIIMFAVSPAQLILIFLNTIGINVFMIENYLPLQITRILPFAYFICYYLGLYFKINGYPKRNYTYLIPIAFAAALSVNFYELFNFDVPLNYITGQIKLMNIIFIVSIIISYDKILIFLKRVNTKILEKIAEYSFGIYFLHMFFIKVLFKVLEITELEYQSNIFLYLLLLVVVTALDVFLTWAVFYVLDKLIKVKFLRKLICIG